MKINEELGKFTGPAEVRIVRTLPGPIERIWEYLIDPEKRSRWFAGGPLEPRVGGTVTLHFLHKKVAPDETPPEEYKETHEVGRTMTGVITRFEPPRVLAFTFGSDGESVATFELTPQGKDVVMVISHRSTAGDLPYMHDFAAGWHSHTAILIALLEGTPKPPFWASHLKLKVEYEKLRIAAQQG